MKRHLDWFQSELRPLTKVLRQLIAEDGNSELKRYLEDVEDHLNGFCMKLAAQSHECTSLKEEHETYQVIGVLTC